MNIEELRIGIETQPRIHRTKDSRFVVNGSELLNPIELLELIVRSKYGCLLTTDEKDLYVADHDGHEFVYVIIPYEEIKSNKFSRIVRVIKDLKLLSESGLDLEGTEVFTKTGLNPGKLIKCDKFDLERLISSLRSNKEVEEWVVDRLCEHIPTSLGASDNMESLLNYLEIVFK